jgi:hypothetical protein
MPQAVRPERPKRRHFNADQKRALKTAQIQKFTRQYGRPAQRGIEPNDRRYDRDAENEISRLKPEDLDRLLRDDED